MMILMEMNWPEAFSGSVAIFSIAWVIVTITKSFR